jgi:uncharacterized protein (TIRG00374 family)
MKTLLRLFAGIAIIALLLWCFGTAGLVEAIANLRPFYLGVYLLLAVAVLVGYSLRWRLVARAVGRTPSLGRLFATRLAGDAIGNLVPSGKLAGEPLRIALLRANGVGGAEASAGVAMDRLLELIGNVLSVVAYTMVFWLARGEGVPERPLQLLVGIVAVAMAGIGAPLVLWSRNLRPFAFLYGERARRAFPRFRSWMEALERTEDHLIAFLRDHPQALLRGVLASVAIETLIVVEYHFLLASFGVSIGLPALLLVILGSGVARAAPTPAGLGALEATQVGALSLVGGRPEVGLVVGLVLRLHETFWMMIGLSALYAQGGTLGRLRASESTG